MANDGGALGQTSGRAMLRLAMVRPSIFSFSLAIGRHLDFVRHDGDESPEHSGILVVWARGARQCLQTEGWNNAHKYMSRFRK